MSSLPNVVWVTMESTRADHTSMGGHDRDTTPNLRRIADRPGGTSFSGCFSHGLWTLTSSASILTGTYPSHHGVGMGSEAVPDALPTVPELLGDAGYRTACLSPNSHLSSATALDRGFDRFAWVSKSTLPDLVDVRTAFRYLRNLRSNGGGLTLDARKHNFGFMMNEVAKRWVDEFRGGDEPFFLYLHHGGPHRPYSPPQRYREAFAEDLPISADEAQAIAFDHHENLFEHVADGCEFDDAEWAAMKALYDAEIAHTDELVGDLFDFVRSNDVGDTVFVVTADHGELFGERGMLAHQVVADDAVTHVPLVVNGLDGVEGYDGEMVQHADVMRTILESVGADTDSLQGIDLREETRDRSVVQRGAERPANNLERIAGNNPDFDASAYLSGQVHALRTSEFKYVRGDDGSALYALPDEERDAAGEHPTVAADLDAALSEWLETDGQPVESGRTEGEFTDEMKDQLSDLGYLVE